MIEYSFSSPADRDIVGNASQLKNTLSDKDQAKFDGEIKLWNRDNGVKTTTPTPQAPDAIEEAQSNAASEMPDIGTPTNEEPEFQVINRESFGALLIIKLLL